MEDPILFAHKEPTPGLKGSSDRDIRRAVEFADPLALRGLLYHITQDEDLVRIGHIMSPGLAGVEVPSIPDPADQALIRTKAVEFLIKFRDSAISLPQSLSKEQVHKAMSLAACQDVRWDQFEYWLEELALDPMIRCHKWVEKPDKAKLKQFSVVVIGAGMGGVNAAIQLKRSGFDFTVFEKNAGAGGVWWQNRYPGARVDLPSRGYAHGFGVDYLFKETFAPQAQTEKYVNWSIDHFGIRQNIHFGTEVLAAHWDEEEALWNLRVRDADGAERTHQAKAIISAVGFLDRPTVPDVPGVSSFKGKIYHTTQLTDDTELAGLRVAIIGTGSTCMQMVPIIAPELKSLTIFQRSPAWTIPVENYRDPLPAEQVWLDANVPFYTNWSRFLILWVTAGPGFWAVFEVDPKWKDPHTTCKANWKAREAFVAYLKEKVGDVPELFAKCLPKYPPFAKRYVLDNGWFDTLRLDHVTLVTEAVDHFTETSLVDKAGVKHEVDVVIFATGFRANDYFWPIDIVGRDEATLGKLWAKDGARAYLGITIPKLPNFFAIYGPNTNPRGNGPILWAEMQTRYALQCFENMIANGHESIEVKERAFDRYNADLDKNLSLTVWLDPRQSSYYKNEFGRSAVMAPWGCQDYWTRVRSPDFTDYQFS